MAKFNSLFKAFNVLFPFADFIYILQLEEYSTARLLHWLPRFFFRRNIQVREKIEWTARAKVTLLLSISGWLIGFVGGLLLCQFALTRILHIVVSLMIVPIAVLAANFFFSTLEVIPKQSIRKRAATLVAQNQAMKVIAIAGSFGKTTTKNFIQQLAKYSYKTQMIPGNINTPGGIANWILNELKPDTEILIAEVDTYKVGEITQSCEILKPDISVLTNIGDQHLVRFRSVDELKTALVEIFTQAKSNASLITTEDTKLQIQTTISSQRLVTVTLPVNSINYKNSTLTVDHLSASNQVNLALALGVVGLLNISTEIVVDTVAKLELPERRQQQTRIFGFEGINDSYNISFSTAAASIAVALALANKANKKLLVLTAGIPELSPENYSHNTELGKLLAKTADHTIILYSMFAQEIADGIKDSTKFTVVPSLGVFINVAAQNFKNSEWYLLFQPELNDLYY